MNNKQLPWLDRPFIKGLGLNREQALYLLFVVLCLVSRLAMLGYRVQSHDESLHTQHSWYYYVGQGYQHNPMMHGPFLFHITALSYILFGDNDFTARLPVALLGTVLVAFPYLLRRYLGRSGALVTSALLLISPSIWYYSRYIRNDVMIALWVMILLWAILEYLREGRDRHLYILAAALSLMYATKEVSFIYTAIFGLFLALLFVVQALRQPWPERNLDLVFVAALGVAVMGFLVLFGGWIVRRTTDSTALPPWGAVGGWVGVLALLAAVAVLLYAMRARLRASRPFQLMIVIGTLILPFASPLPMLLAQKLGAAVVNAAADPLTVAPFWSNLANLEVLSYHAPHLYYSGAILALTCIVAAAIGLLWDWRRWAIAAAIYLAIFLVLYSSVFTNGAGIASGWIGSLGYWLEQQEVQRGGQPWFYYFVVLPFYDFLPLLGALAATVMAAVRGIRRLIAAPSEGQREENGSAVFVPFLLFWTLLSWVGYSYAGEKMPWLVVHLTLPMILLTGWLMHHLLEAVEWKRVWETHGWLLVLLLPVLVAAVAGMWKGLAAGPFRGVELEQLIATGDFFAGLVGALFLGALVVLLWRRVGARNGLLLAALTVILVLSLLTIRIGYRFCFVNFEYPTEFLVYAHESGDVRTTMEQLEEISIRVNGAPRSVDVTYGSDGSWPFIWYLRDYPNARYYGDQPSREAVLATAIIAGRDQWAVVEPYVRDDYYRYDYNFLWWPMEDYRRLTWAKLWEWLSDPQKRAALWQIFYQRQYTLYDEITGSHHTLDDWPLRGDFRLYIRKDVAERVWNIGVGALPETPPVSFDVYREGWRALRAQRVWGTEGSGPGQFRAPRGIAVSTDGFVYVADSQNHRIQKFTLDGQFVAAWGSYGDCGMIMPDPGTFCEPWGVAVAPNGDVYVADTWAHRVQRFTADGAFVSQWGVFGQHAVGDPLGQARFYGPRAVAVGSDGHVYVVDTGNKRIQVFDADGNFLYEWGGAGAALGQMEEPVGLALGADGRVYVADSWNFRVQVFSRNGASLLSWPIDGWNNASVDEKPYLAIDDAGRVYVSDPGHYRILVFDHNGNYLYSFGQFGFDDASFALPMGVATGPDNSLYVTDAVGNRVMVFQQELLEMHELDANEP